MLSFKVALDVAPMIVVVGAAAIAQDRVEKLARKSGGQSTPDENWHKHPGLYRLEDNAGDQDESP